MRKLEQLAKEHEVRCESALADVRARDRELETVREKQEDMKAEAAGAAAAHAAALQVLERQLAEATKAVEDVEASFAKRLEAERAEDARKLKQAAETEAALRQENAQLTEQLLELDAAKAKAAKLPQLEEEVRAAGRAPSSPHAKPLALSPSACDFLLILTLSPFRPLDPRPR